MSHLLQFQNAVGEAGTKLAAFESTAAIGDQLDFGIMGMMFSVGLYANANAAATAGKVAVVYELI
jgi:hypothetical protein